MGLLKKQAKLITSQADFIRWSDGFGVGKTFGAIIKSLYSPKNVYYVCSRPKYCFEQHINVAHNFGNTISRAHLNYKNDSRIISFVNDNFNFYGITESLIVFDSSNVENDVVTKLLLKNKVVMVESGPFSFTETCLKDTQEPNPYLVIYDAR